jgi:RNA-directed DNA polymerase
MKVFIEQTDGQEGQAHSWASINWQGVVRNVRRLQERIYRATQEKAWQKVRSLQKLLQRATSNKLLSIRQVTLENQGRKTPGIDGVIYDTPAKRLALSNKIGAWQSYRPQAVKRVIIPKGEGKQRPLGIPTQKDRVRQAIIKRGLEAEWEARFEANSYGFRPGRSAQDAIAQIRKTVCQKGSSQWVLDADIKGCFDNIAHQPLLQKIPGVRAIVGRWLKAGIIAQGQFQPSPQGTPQGGIISPLLANIALDGLERLFGCENSKGSYVYPGQRKGLNKGVSLIRYADDFVVTAPSKEVIEDYVIPTLNHFLAQRGLALNPDKTNIVHISQGFNFLGFTIRKYKQGILITPQKQKVKAHLNQIKSYLTQHKQATVTEVIHHLNPIIRGWTNYYRHCNAAKTFKYLSFRYWHLLWRWAKRRHPNKGLKWIRRKYFTSLKGRNWVFAENDRFLLDPATVKVREFFKVKGYASPLDPALRSYWANRHRGALISLTPSAPKRILFHRQDYRCLHCKLPFLPDDDIVKHHLASKLSGGRDALFNLVALHRHCHLQLHQRLGFRVF